MRREDHQGMRPQRLAARWLLAALALFASFAWGQSSVVDSMRGATPIPEKTHAPVLRNWVNNDVRQPRNYDAQPPIIPHRVDGYQIDKNFNKCLDCHARAKTELSQAIPVSETHYIDRNGKVLDHVSTRRYFCLQCHVAQEPVQPLVGNSFQNLGTATRKPTEQPGTKK